MKTDTPSLGQTRHCTVFRFPIKAAVSIFKQLEFWSKASRVCTQKVCEHLINTDSSTTEVKAYKYAKWCFFWQ